MSRAKLAVTVVAGFVALSFACTSHEAGPASPSSTRVPGTIDAAVDGSTLKATAPIPTSPINGVKLPQGQPVNLVVTNATTPYTSGVALAYRFEVQNAAGSVLESQVVASGQGTTSRTVAAKLDDDQTYRWRARAEYNGDPGPWSALQSFVTPANDGYIRGTELYDPLTNGKTIGTIDGSRNVTFVPGQGIRMNDDFAYVVYQMPQVFSSGEMSVEVTGLGPNGAPGKARIFSMLDRLGVPGSSAKYSINVQYRGAGGAPDNCIAWKAVLGDNANSLEPTTAKRFESVFLLDPSKVYLWQAFWTPTSVRVVVKEGGTTGPVVYDYKVDATSGTTNWNPEKMFAFLGTNNASYTGFDGTRIGMTLRNLWVGSTPRPTTLP
jgi:hypothetical protein